MVYLEKTMASLPGWLPILIERINWGCSVSPWFTDLADEHKILSRGRKIILDLWPFIRELPLNIASVRDSIPAGMTSATKLLNQFADSELQYQKLFLQQFDLAGISPDDSQNTNQRAEKLRLVMSTNCTQKSFVDGVHAIVTAELAASLLCRWALPLYENYFEKHAHEYEGGLIDSGLEWLRLHAKTHIRHAIWMKRMLSDLDDGAGNEIPPAANSILAAVLELWECSPESQELAAGRII